jgi:folylpolyglutamate synthase/dihydropteroate synthase
MFAIPTLVMTNTNAGLYTSPHLVAVRERIRINGAPISEEEFARYFFEVWDKLESNPTVCCIAVRVSASY